MSRRRSGAARFLQVYVFRDRGITDELIAQAVAAGFSAVFLTVDIPALGSRDRERRIQWMFPEESLPAVRYAQERGIAGEGLEILDPTIDWAYLERLCSSLTVPVVVKGVLDPEDAVLAAEHGQQASWSRITVDGSWTRTGRDRRARTDRGRGR